MRQRFYLLPLFVFALLVAGCNSFEDRTRIEVVFAEINQLLAQEDLIVKKIQGRPRIFSGEYLKDFPANRHQLQTTVREQIDSFHEINKLNELQLKKWDEMGQLNPDGNTEKWQIECQLLRQLQEKRMDNVNLSIEKFGLILDNAIDTRQKLDERISQIEQKQSSIDKEIERLQGLRKENKEISK